MNRIGNPALRRYITGLAFEYETLKFYYDEAEKLFTMFMDSGCRSDRTAGIQRLPLPPLTGAPDRRPGGKNGAWIKTFSAANGYPTSGKIIYSHREPRRPRKTDGFPDPTDSKWLMDKPVCPVAGSPTGTTLMTGAYAEKLLTDFLEEKITVGPDQRRNHSIHFRLVFVACGAVNRPHSSAQRHNQHPNGLANSSAGAAT